MSPEQWLILGHFGGRNVGDEAMLRGFVDALRHEHSLRFLAVGSDIRNDPLAIASALLKSRGIILGGGSHFHDHYRGPQHRRHLLVLAAYGLVLATSRALGKPVLVLSAGLGPLRRRITKTITRLALRCANAVCVRDRQSLRVAAALGMGGTVFQGFDLAALLVDRGAREKETAPARGRLLLGLSLMAGVNFREAAAGVGDRFNACLIEAIGRALRRDPTLEIRLFVMGKGRNENDEGVCRWAHDALSPRASGRVQVVDRADDPRAVLGAIRECTAIMATRYHAGVLGFLSERPMALVPYHRKIRDLAEDIGLPSSAILEPDRAWTPDEMDAVLRGLLAHQEGYAASRPVTDAVQAAETNIMLFARYRARS